MSKTQLTTYHDQTPWLELRKRLIAIGVTKHGNQRKFARAIGVSDPTVHHWFCTKLNCGSPPEPSYSLGKKIEQYLEEHENNCQ